MSVKACVGRPESHAERRTGVRKGRGKHPALRQALGRVLWTTTGITYRVGRPPRATRRPSLALDLLDGIAHGLLLYAIVIITIGG